MALRVDLLESLVEAKGIHAAWDELAVRAAHPYCAPDWILAWWQHAAPADAAMRVLAAWDGGTLVGLAPLYVTRPGRAYGDYATMAARFSSPVGPLVDPERPAEVRAALLDALAGQRQRPALLRLDEQAPQEQVLDEVRSAWPGRAPWAFLTPPTVLPVVELEGLDYDGWLAQHSTKFRQKARRLRRRLEDEGARFETAGPEQIEFAVDAFLRLHAARWEGRGGSDALVPGIRQLLVEVGHELAPDGRMRMHMIRTDEEVIAVNVVVAAGDQAAAWNAGYTTGWDRFSPSNQLLLHTIKDATERGDRSLGLGPGPGAYKLQMAQRAEDVGGVTLVPHGGAYARTRLRLVREQARWELSKRLTPEAKAKLRRKVRR